jgi:hypothetical protein
MRLSAMIGSSSKRENSDGKHSPTRLASVVFYWLYNLPMKAHTLKIDAGSVVARNNKDRVCDFGSGSQMTNMLQMPTHNNNNKSNKSNKPSHRSPNLINMHICTYNIRTFREEEKERNSKKKYQK